MARGDEARGEAERGEEEAARETALGELEAARVAALGELELARGEAARRSRGVLDLEGATEEAREFDADGTADDGCELGAEEEPRAVDGAEGTREPVRVVPPWPVAISSAGGGSSCSPCCRATGGRLALFFFLAGLAVGLDSSGLTSSDPMRTAPGPLDPMRRLAAS